ncbi:MAG: hypothetical protein A3I66_21215 [Burkholderiales bacterium RIFCSPLOWO2_02_FULL_57_36]|nr:MAG: hypothetical protein A3I66_21215 [Burkholderiales bacterium RIFCSPLOWO2_02_FULL_57_36]
MNPRLAFLRTAALTACLGTALPAGAQTPVEINFATAYSVDNFHTKNLQQYADEVRRATADKVAMRVHAAGSLIKPGEIFAGVREGKAEAGEVIMSSLANESPLFGIDALPFIVSGYADARHMWNASRPAIDKALAARGLQLLYAVPWPPQNLYSQPAINAVGNLKGLRMRAYNPATVRIAELVHARPVSIQVVDLAKAIADGQLELMITSSSTGVETKAWTRLGHYYKVNAWIPKNIVFINKTTFGKLDAASRTILLDLARNAEERGWKLSENSDREYEAQLAANKINVSTMDFFMRQYLDRIGEKLAREWLKQAGNDEWKVLLQYTTERSQQTPAVR